MYAFVFCWGLGASQTTQRKNLKFADVREKKSDVVERGFTTNGPPPRGSTKYLFHERTLQVEVTKVGVALYSHTLLVKHRVGSPPTHAYM